MVLSHGLLYWSVCQTLISVAPLVVLVRTNAGRPLEEVVWTAVIMAILPACLNQLLYEVGRCLGG